MTKRAQQFERRANDAYDTPFQAAKPLIAHLPSSCYFVEPCAGKGDLIRHLEHFSHKCLHASDIAPRAAGIKRQSIFDVRLKKRYRNLFFITNPPWERAILHPIIRHLCPQAPTWLLFEADWMHTKQAAEFLPYCQKIVSIGRVKWIEGSASVGKDNMCWYRFDAQPTSRIDFIGPQT